MQDLSSALINQVVRIKGEKIFFFDKNGIYKSASIEKDKKGKIDWSKYLTKKDFVKYDFERDDFCRVVFNLNIPNLNNSHLKHVLSWMKDGENLENLKTRLQKGKEDDLERLIARIEKPLFIREHSNPNERTFDYIYMDVLLTTNWKRDSREKFVKEKLPEIKKLVVEKLEKNSEFHRYGVPINFLKISRISYFAKKNFMQIVFALKEI